jgi:iron-sulfur cluster insertion protein
VTITLSPRAAGSIAGLLREEGASGHGLRVQVLGGGCSGFSYDLGLVPAPEPGDVVLESQGVRLFVDPRALTLLAGTTIDYDETFRFENPKARSTCRCGASFAP